MESRIVKIFLFCIALIISTIGTTHARSMFADISLDETKERFPAWIKSQQLVGEALYRSRDVSDETCEKQWQLPITFGTYREMYPDDYKILFKNNGLSLGPKATVIYAPEGSGLHFKDVISGVEGNAVSGANMYEMTYLGNQMSSWNLSNSKKRNSFSVSNENTNQEVLIEPYQTCKGRIVVSIFKQSKEIDLYYGAFVFVNLETFVPDITPEEVLWMTLWVQGFEVSGQGNMSMLVFTRGVLGAIKGYMAGSATNSVVQAGTKGVQSLARETASQVAQSTATIAAKKAVVEAAKNQAEGMIQETMVKAAAAQAATRFGTAVVGKTMSLENLFVESAFAKADAWAFAKLIQLEVDPSVVVSLHKKLVKAQVADSPFVLNQERQQQFDAMLDTFEASKMAGNSMPPSALSEASTAQEK